MLDRNVVLLRLAKHLRTRPFCNLGLIVTHVLAYAWTKQKTSTAITMVDDFAIGKPSFSTSEVSKNHNRGHVSGLQVALLLSPMALGISSMRRVEEPKGGE